MILLPKKIICYGDPSGVAVKLEIQLSLPFAYGFEVDEDFFLYCLEYEVKYLLSRAVKRKL